MKTISVKTWALILCALLLLSMLAACGGGSGTPAGGDTDYEPDTTTDYEPEDETPDAADAGSAEAIPMGHDSGFVIDLPAGYRYDDAWSCYLSADNAVRIWAPDTDFYETANEFRNVLEEHEGELKAVELDGRAAWLREEPEGFYGAETHYYVSLSEFYEERSGCHLWVSSDEGDLTATQTQAIRDALKTIRREGEAVGERAAAVEAANADPYESLTIDFTPAETAAMSTFMSGGRYAVVGNSLFGEAFDSNAQVEFVRIDLTTNGSFAEADGHVVLDRGVAPSFVTVYGDDVYYIRGGEGIYKVSRSGGEPQAVVPDAADYLQIHGDKLYYCDTSYAFCRADLDGGNVTTVLDKEVYFPYFVNDTWLIYQDDADDESLHLRHVMSGEDITLCPIPTYSPVIFGSDLYCETVAGDDAVLAKIDMTYTPDSQDNFAIEYGDQPAWADITIGADGYLYYGLKDGLHIDRWKDAANANGDYELVYRYLGEEYEVYWRYDDQGLISGLYVTLVSSGGSQSLPRFD